MTETKMHSFLRHSVLVIGTCFAQWNGVTAKGIGPQAGVNPQAVL